MSSTNAYSKDLRLKTLAAIDRGRSEVTELFGVSRSTIERWLKRRRQTGGWRFAHRVGLARVCPGHLLFEGDLG
jgi:transposase